MRGDNFEFDSWSLIIRLIPGLEHEMVAREWGTLSLATYKWAHWRTNKPKYLITNQGTKLDPQTFMHGPAFLPSCFQYSFSETKLWLSG